MIIEEHVEEAVKSVIGADAVIVRLVVHGLEIRDWRDNSASKSGRMLVVHAAPCERLSPAANFYKVPVTVAALTHQADDKNRAVCEEIYKALLGALAGTTAAALTTALPGTAGSSITTIDGIVMGQGQEGADESHQFIAAQADIFATATPT